MHSDPVADMLTRIRNACRARKPRVDIPASKLKTKIAEVLKQEGYIDEFRQVSDKVSGQGIIEIHLRYDSSNEPVIGNLKRISKPGLRNYMGWEDIPKVRNGQGILIMTTSQGLMTDRQARKEHVGGEALCAVS